MKKYFKEEKTEKISLLELYEEKEKEYQKIVDELEESIVIILFVRSFSCH